MKYTNGLWTHATRDTKFILVVNNVGARYTTTNNIKYLLNILKDFYKITMDWTGSHYIGVDLKLNYKLPMCNLSMKGYVNMVLKNLCFKQSK